MSEDKGTQAQAERATSRGKVKAVTDTLTTIGMVADIRTGIYRIDLGK